MLIREVEKKDTAQLIELYMKHLTRFPPKAAQVNSEWETMVETIIANPDYHLIVCEVDGELVSSVTLVVIPNLTHNRRPYAVMENVVTHSDHRNMGYASALMDHASDIASNKGCYKIMLMTGSKRESTLNFYRKAGFNVGEKTACLKRL